MDYHDKLITVNSKPITDLREFKIKRYTKFISYKIVFASFLILAFGLASGEPASAATITVNTDANPSACTLDEAIQNINDQADTNTDCIPIGSYGTNDTVSIPEGIVLLTANLPLITESVIIEGAGMGESVVDGGGQWSVFSASNDAAAFGFRSFTITAFATNAAIYTDSGDVTVEYVEVDGTGSDFSGSAAGIGLINSAGITDNNIVINNVHVHSINHDTASINAIAIGTSGSVGTSFSAYNITVSNIQNSQQNRSVNGFLVGIGIFGGSPGTESINGTVSNITITDIEADNANGLAVIVAAGSLSNTASLLNLRNATLTNLTGASAGAAVAVGGAGVSPGVTGAGNLVVENIILADNNLTFGCGIQDITGLFGGAGIGTGTIMSNGGNIAEDASCQSYFTHPTDQNNVSNLATTLGVLSDNGGFVPTIPLLEGSPAVDAGIAVAGLATDARLASRPQGNGFDSGAYESPYARVPQQGVLLADTGQDMGIITMFALTAITLSSVMLLKKINN